MSTAGMRAGRYVYDPIWNS